ncbi:MAG: LysR substrate-binding domain-containing protein [Rhizobiaceae bacterium]|nr:LysR substrate-binding domain-containing protein [Rhizobiaceae bacterium]
MELKQLRYFLAVADHGGFTKAAVALSMAQSVLSRQVQKLEEELNIALLYRNGRGIVLTEAGNRLIDHARSIVDAETMIRADVDTLRASPTGKLAIGLPPSMAPVLSVPLITRFREIYPQIRLSVQEGFNGHVLEWLANGKIDVAVLYNAPKISTLMTQTLIDEELLLVGPASTPEYMRTGPVSATMLGQLPLILPSPPHGIRALVESILGSVGVTANIECEIDSLSTTLQLVELGVGYTVLPYASVIKKVNAGQLVAMRIEDVCLSRRLVLATSTQRPITFTTRFLAKTVTQLVRDLVDDGTWMPLRNTSWQGTQLNHKAS